MNIHPVISCFFSTILILFIPLTATSAVFKTAVLTDVQGMDYGIGASRQFIKFKPIPLEYDSGAGDQMLEKSRSFLFVWHRLGSQQSRFDIGLMAKVAPELPELEVRRHLRHQKGYAPESTVGLSVGFFSMAKFSDAYVRASRSLYVDWLGYRDVGVPVYLSWSSSGRNQMSVYNRLVPFIRTHFYESDMMTKTEFREYGAQATFGLSLRRLMLEGTILRMSDTGWQSQIGLGIWR